jgi:hypothetical protein
MILWSHFDPTDVPMFHVFLDGETHSPVELPTMVELSDFDRGFLVGLLVGEGSFGGDGKHPQVVLRMHVRHEAIFRWLEARFPDCRLYGPYNHGGRRYFQWMARGEALVRDLLPILETELSPELDQHSYDRLRLMCDRYAVAIARLRR